MSMPASNRRKIWLDQLLEADAPDQQKGCDHFHHAERDLNRSLSPPGKLGGVFLLVPPISVQYASMISREEREAVWTDAYNASLTGLLAAKAGGMEKYTANNVSVITDQCKALADQALKDADRFK